MRRVCVLILVIAVLASAQDWNVTSANWTFQGAFPANPNDPTFSGTCCLPAVMTMNVTMNGSNGIDFDIFYSNNPACGKVQNLQQHVKTAQFEGVSTSGKGGHLLLTYVTYWPNNNTLFIQPGDCIWVYTIPGSSPTTWDVNYLMTGPWNLQMSWGTYENTTCCLPLNNQFMVIQNTINSPVSFQFNWDFQNVWCLLFWPWETNVFTSPSSAGGGFTFTNLTIGYYPLNNTIGLFFDSCASYFTRGCAPGSWWNNGNQTCLNCSSNCASCVTYSQCTSCATGQFLFMGSCFNCEQGDILNPSCTSYLAGGKLTGTNLILAIVLPAVFGGLLFILLVYTCVKYARKGNDKTRRMSYAMKTKQEKEEEAKYDSVGIGSPGLGGERSGFQSIQESNPTVITQPRQD